MFAVILKRAIPRILMRNELRLVLPRAISAEFRPSSPRKHQVSPTPCVVRRQTLDLYYRLPFRRRECPHSDAGELGSGLLTRNPPVVHMS